jgi:ABC-type transport system involved in multi-copper enzyme maturation permease subunit
MGVVFRRGLPAVAAAVVLLVVPQLLATSSVLPSGAGQWLTRVTPAAAFAVLQSIPAYPQVYYPYGPMDGYYPLAPWAGLGVLLLYAAAALGLAVVRFRRADA